MTHRELCFAQFTDDIVTQRVTLYDDRPFIDKFVRYARIKYMAKVSNDKYCHM